MAMDAITTDTIPTGSPTTSAPTASAERAALRRPFAGRMITGVAAGVAEYFGIDVTLVRIAFAVLAVVGGAGIPLYLAGLLLIPDEGSDQSIASSILKSFQSK
jgi:phage shock protein PspC (stress-responsive transcriptional regulator)